MRTAGPRALVGPVVAAAAAVGAVVAVRLGDPTVPNTLFPRCPFNLLTGLDCPGCGSTRMLACLTRGDLVGALRYNALALLSLPVFVLVWWRWLRAALAGRPLRLRPHPRATWVFAVAAGTWLIVRNIPAWPFTLLQV